MPDEQTPPPAAPPPATPPPAQVPVQPPPQPRPVITMPAPPVEDVAPLKNRISELEAEVASTKARAAMDLEMVKTGGNFVHPSVQRVVRREYADYRQDAGDNALSFKEWLASEDTKSNPVIGVHFPKEEPGDQDTGKEKKPPKDPVKPPPATDPNGGTGQPGGPDGQRWTREQILAAQRNGTFSSQAEAIGAQLEAEGLLKNVPKRRTK